MAPACLGLQVAAFLLGVVRPTSRARTHQGGLDPQLALVLLGPPSRAQAHQGGWGRQLLAGHATFQAALPSASASGRVSFGSSFAESSACAGNATGPAPLPSASASGSGAFGSSFAESSACAGNATGPAPLPSANASGSGAFGSSFAESSACAGNATGPAPLPSASASGSGAFGYSFAESSALWAGLCLAQVMPPSAFRGWFPDPPLERKASTRLESPAFSWTCHHPAPSRARTHQGGRLRVPLCGVFCTLGQASPFGGIFL